MPTAYDIEPTLLIQKTAEHLKKELEQPQWTKFVKTSSGKERPPAQPDWYYYRAASVLRKIYKLGPIGTNKLKVKYGAKKNRGHAPDEFRPGTGKIIRSIMQQLEKQGYLKQETKGAHKGRILTPKGRKLLDTIVRLKDGKQSKRGTEQSVPAPEAS